MLSSPRARWRALRPRVERRPPREQWGERHQPRMATLLHPRARWQGQRRGWRPWWAAAPEEQHRPDAEEACFLLLLPGEARALVLPRHLDSSPGAGRTCGLQWQWRQPSRRVAQAYSRQRRGRPVPVAKRAWWCLRGPRGGQVCWRLRPSPVSVRAWRRLPLQRPDAVRAWQPQLLRQVGAARVSERQHQLHSHEPPPYPARTPRSLCQLPPGAAPESWRPRRMAHLQQHYVAPALRQLPAASRKCSSRRPQLESPAAPRACLAAQSPNPAPTAPHPTPDVPASPRDSHPAPSHVQEWKAHPLLCPSAPWESLSSWPGVAPGASRRWDVRQVFPGAEAAESARWRRATTESSRA